MHEPKPMTPRERVKAAFEGRPVDRVPKFDQTVFSHVATKVMGRPVLTGGGGLRHSEAAARFAGKRALNEWRARYYEDYLGFELHMKYDMIRHPWRERRTPTKKIDENTYLFGDPGGEWFLNKFDAESDNWHSVDDWLRDAGLIDGLEVLRADLEKQDASYKGPEWGAFQQELLEDYVELRRRLPEHAIAADCAYCCISMYDPAWMQLLHEDAELAGRDLDRQADIACLYIEKLAAVGVDVVFGGGDIALNTGPAYAPNLVRDITAPRVRRIRDFAEKHGVWYVFKTDGNTWPIGEYLFGPEHGASHGYSEIDYNAGMRLDELHAKFPRLTLIGNVDSAQILSRGTVEAVRRHSREVLEAGAGHHHIYGISNSVMPETPVENFLAMHEVHDAFRVPEPAKA